MKVRYVTMSFPASSETFASNDVRALAALGVDIGVHCLRRANPDATLLLVERRLERIPVTHNHAFGSLGRALGTAWQNPGAAYYLLTQLFRTCVRSPRQLMGSLYLLPRVLEVFGTLLRDRPDVVHAYWAHYPSAVLLLVQRFMPDVVTSISFSAYDIHYRYPLSGQAAARADIVRTLSNYTAKEVADAFRLREDALEVIHDGVDMNLVPPATRRIPRRIVTAGRIVRAKGMHHVLSTFANVHRKFPDATLRVLGSGPELPHLAALARDLGLSSAVTFLGHVAQAEVLAELQAAEVFLFLSLDERLPNAVKEAMVCGSVCVVSKTPGIDELIREAVTGFIVEQGDVDGATARIASVFDGSVDSDAMTRAAAAHIRNHFDLGDSVLRYVELWQGCLVQRKGESARAEST